MKKHGFTMLLALSLASNAAMAAASQSLPLGNAKLAGGLKTAAATSLNADASTNLGGAGPAGTLDDASNMQFFGSFYRYVAWASCDTSLVLQGLYRTRYTFTVRGRQLNNAVFDGGTINGYPLPIEQIHAYCRGFLHDNFCMGNLMVPAPDQFQYTYGPNHIVDSFSCN